MAERICLLTGYGTTCNDGCYNCGCGGEVALKNFYVPIYNVQRVCDIVKGFECTSIEGEEIAEYIRNELEKMTVCIEKKAADVQPVKRDEWISCKDRMPKENTLVLCYAKSTAGEGNNYFLGAQAHDEFWFLKANDIGHVSCPVLHWEVTHWMPLPEPPKDGDT